MNEVILVRRISKNKVRTAAVQEMRVEKLFIFVLRTQDSGGLV
jgi:hypothetical protein